MIHYLDCINDTDLDYICNPCADVESGRVRSLCLIKKGEVLPNPLTKFDIEMMLAQGKIHVMPETSGVYDGGTPKMGAGYGDNKEMLLGADYSATIKDPNYILNRDFWQAIEAQEWHVAFRTDTKLIVAYEDVTVTAKNAVEEAIDTPVVWAISLKWIFTK